MKRALATNPCVLISMTGVLTAATYLIWHLWHYPVLVPWADEWRMVPVMENVFTGRLTFTDLWGQSNEHRIFFPRIIIVALGLMTRWNIGYEIVLNFLCAAATLGLFLRVFLEKRENLSRPERFWIPVAFAVFTFSLRQWENWTWGVQIQMYLCLFLATSGLWLLDRATPDKKIFLAGLLLGIGSSYSFAGGFAFWPAGLVLLLTAQGLSRKSRAKLSAVWLTAAALTLFFYLQGYEKPGHHAALVWPWDDPAAYLRYVFAYLGSGVVAGSEREFMTPAFTLGLSAFLIQVICIFGLLRHPERNRRTGLFFTALFIFATGTAAFTALGRAGFYDRQALSSRYVTHSFPFWISFFFLTAQAAALPSFRGMRRFTMAASRLFLISVFILGVYASMQSSDELIARSLRAREASLIMQDPSQAQAYDLFPAIA